MESKLDRLQTAGWKVGSVREFLGLSSEEAAGIECALEQVEGSIGADAG